MLAGAACVALDGSTVGIVVIGASSGNFEALNSLFFFSVENTSKMSSKSSSDSASLSSLAAGLMISTM